MISRKSVSQMLLTNLLFLSVSFFAFADNTTLTASTGVAEYNGSFNAAAIPDYMGCVNYCDNEGLSTTICEGKCEKDFTGKDNTEKLKDCKDDCSTATCQSNCEKHPETQVYCKEQCGKYECLWGVSYTKTEGKNNEEALFTNLIAYGKSIAGLFVEASCVNEVIAASGTTCGLLAVINPDAADLLDQCMVFSTLIGTLGASVVANVADIADDISEQIKCSVNYDKANEAKKNEAKANGTMPEYRKSRRAACQIQNQETRLDVLNALTNLLPMLMTITNMFDLGEVSDALGLNDGAYNSCKEMWGDYIQMLAAQGQPTALYSNICEGLNESTNLNEILSKDVGENPTMYFDKSCKNIKMAPYGVDNLVNEKTPCVVDSYTLMWAESPVALVWDENAIGHATVSDFSLGLTKQAKSWHLWKASSGMPLLVYDPEAKRVVTSAEQLFGQITMGKTWANGFEALASLDQNKDGKIAGSELANIALWFDKNQNAISEEGEVIGAEQAGLSALFFKVDSVDTVSNDLHIDRGYERIVDGEVRFGKSVDWFAKPYSTKEEAEKALYQSLQTSSYDAMVPLTIAEEPKVNQQDKGLRAVEGLWVWKLDQEFVTDKIGNVNGILGIATLPKINNGKVFGFTSRETVFKPNSGNVNSQIAKKPLQNLDIRKLGDGSISLSFRVMDERGFATETKAKVSADGRMMTGVSAQQVQDPKDKNKRSVMHYSWRAGKYHPDLKSAGKIS